MEMEGLVWEISGNGGFRVGNSGNGGYSEGESVEKEG